MFDSVVLDVVIGLVFVYLLYSLLATIVQEIIATNFAFRAKVLEKAIARMLDDGDSTRRRISNFVTLFVRRKKVPKVTAAFYSHPLIKYLGQDKWHRKPAYLSAGNFSKVVIDLLRGKQTVAGKDHRAEIEAALKDKKSGWDKTTEISQDTIDYLNSMWVDAQGDIDKFKGAIEDWYNETMDRAAGWYKQYTQVVLLFVGMGIAMTFNVDTLEIVKKLEKDPKLREQIVAQAETFVKAHPNLKEELVIEQEKNAALLAFVKDTTRKTKDIAELNKIARQKYDTLQAHRDTLLNRAAKLVKEDIAKVNNVLALGWKDYKDDGCWFSWPRYVLHATFCHRMKFLGIFLTALALSLGAPFWFDLLSKLIKVRGALKGGEAEKDKNADKATEGATVKRVG